MMYISKGIICKRKSRFGIYIRHFGQPMELLGEEARIWINGQYGFAYVDTPKEAEMVRRLAKKCLIIVKENCSEFDKYDALCRGAICANPKIKIDLIPFRKTEKRVLIWLRKAGVNLSLPELVCLEDKGIEPKRGLLYSENSRALLSIIHPCAVSMAGALENRMKHSIARKRTVDAVLNLLRRKRIVIM